MHSRPRTAKTSVWGLTGGIGSGKTTVARLLAERGFTTLDADEIARELRAPGGAAFGAISARFGTADKQEIRDLVFNDEQARKDLEAILHPLIKKATDARLAAYFAQAGEPFKPVLPVIYEASLLVETGRYKDFRGLITVVANPTLRAERIQAREASLGGLAQKMIAAQISDEERERVADIVIRNEGSLEELQAQVDAVAKQIASPPYD